MKFNMFWKLLILGIILLGHTDVLSSGASFKPTNDPVEELSLITEIDNLANEDGGVSALEHPDEAETITKTKEEKFDDDNWRLDRMIQESLDRILKTDQDGIEKRTIHRNSNSIRTIPYLFRKRSFNGDSEYNVQKSFPLFRRSSFTTDSSSEMPYLLRKYLENFIRRQHNGINLKSIPSSLFHKEEEGERGDDDRSTMPFLFKRSVDEEDEQEVNDENKRGSTVPFLFRKYLSSLFRRDDNDERSSMPFLFRKTTERSSVPFLFRRDDGSDQKTLLDYIIWRNIDKSLKKYEEESIKDANPVHDKSYNFENLFRKTQVPFLFKRSDPNDLFQDSLHSYLFRDHLPGERKDNDEI